MRFNCLNQDLQDWRIDRITVVCKLYSCGNVYLYLTLSSIIGWPSKRVRSKVFIGLENSLDYVFRWSRKERETSAGAEIYVLNFHIVTSSALWILPACSQANQDCKLRQRTGAVLRLLRITKFDLVLQVH